MEKREKILNEFYNNACNEDSRLESNHGKVEFITTVKYIDKYLKKGDRILEVGAGTGRYSLYYAKKGYRIDAIEYVKHNVDILKSKIDCNMDIKCSQGDALDLSRYPDNTFNVTLVLGPLYHLYTLEDQEKAISEAIRVTKKDGIIFIAYLTSDSIVISYGLLKGHLFDEEDAWYDNKYKISNIPEEIFSAFYIEEFKNIMNKFNIEYLNNIATDGMSHHFKDRIDSLTEEEFNIWLDYHLTTCEREDLQGYSNHMLYICKKK